MNDSNGIDSLNNLIELSNMTAEEAEMFKSQVLSYCKANLVKIIAYLPSPYVETYMTDQVFCNLINLIILMFSFQEMTFITFISNLGGMLGLCMGLSFVSVLEIVFYAGQLLIKNTKLLNKI